MFTCLIKTNLNLLKKFLDLKNITSATFKIFNIRINEIWTLFKFSNRLSELTSPKTAKVKTTGINKIITKKLPLNFGGCLNFVFHIYPLAV